MSGGSLCCTLLLDVLEETPVKAIWGVTAALLAGVSGCASKSAIPDVTEDGLARVDIRGVDAAYRRPGADLARYSKVMLDPVQVAFDPDWDPKRTGSNLKVSAEDRERIRRELAELFMQVFSEELSKDGGAPLVTSAGPDVLRLSTGLADVYINAPDTMEAGRSRTYVMSAGRATLVAGSSRFGERRHPRPSLRSARGEQYRRFAMVRQHTQLCRGAARVHSLGEVAASALRRRA